MALIYGVNCARASSEALLKAFNGAQSTKNCQLSIYDRFSLLKLDFSNWIIALQYISHQKKIYSAFMMLVADF